MKIVFGIIIAILLASCGSTQRLLSPNPSIKDSTRVETKVVTVFIKDTVTITVPEHTLKTATRDSSSHLETDYAVSDASIDSTGTLHHTLANKAGSVPVPAETKVIYRDSIVYREIEVPTPYPVEVKVPRELTWWQQTKMKGFWILLALLALSCRKPIFALIRRFI
jgi:hypothetical protein